MPHPMLDTYKFDLAGMIAADGQDATLAGTALSAIIGMERSGAPDFAPERYRYDEAIWATATVHADDVAAEPAEGDALVVDGTTYTVRYAETIMYGAGWRLAATREIRV